MSPKDESLLHNTAKVETTRTPDASDPATVPTQQSDEASATHNALETPDLLEVVFEHCDAETLRRISTANPRLEAATAPRMYRKVTLSASGWWCNGLPTPYSTPSPQQIKYLSHARALSIHPEPITYDLSSCSFAGVEVVEYEPYVVTTPDDYDYTPRNDEYDGTAINEDRFNDDRKLAELIADNMAKCPDLRPGTVVDKSGTTIPVRWVEQGYDPLSALSEGEGRTDIVNRHATRLVTHTYVLARAVGPEIERPPTTEERKTHLQAYYPNLSEVVIPLMQYEFDRVLLVTLLALVEMGYKVVLAGYQEQNHDKEQVKKALLARNEGPEPGPKLDQLVDNLVDRVHKMSLREFYALPYVRRYQLDGEADRLIEYEEDFYRNQSITMRHTSKAPGTH